MNPWGRPCYFQTPNFRFFDRRAFLEKLNCHLRPTQPPSFQAVTLFGEGGVGKSAIAQRYIHDAWCKNEYDAAFWIDCGTTASMSQSFARMAWALGLNGPGPALDDVHWILVRNWLRTTNCKWLLVYDNVESANLQLFWPDWYNMGPSSCGRAIVTTRNTGFTHNLGTWWMEVPAWSGDEHGGAFLRFLANDPLDKPGGDDDEIDEKSAKELSGRFSNHPLSIVLLRGLIRYRSCSISYFREHHDKYYRKSTWRDELHALTDHLIDDVLKELPDSRTLLGIASFLVSESIQQSIFKWSGDGVVPDDLQFCTSEDLFRDAIRPLLMLGLVKRGDGDDTDRTVKEASIYHEYSCSEFVQAQVRFNYPPSQRNKAFENAVTLVSYRCPPSSPPMGSLWGPLNEEWNRWINQVLHLKDRFNELVATPKRTDITVVNIDTLAFCRLLGRCAIYLATGNTLDHLNPLCHAMIQAADLLSDKEQAIIFTSQANALLNRGRPNNGPN